MKKIILLSTMLLALISVKGQETTTDNSERKNDIMISPIELIVGNYINISYERLLNNSVGIGLNGIFSFGEKTNDALNFTQFSPYIRKYFGNKYAGGFFIEGFVPITSTPVTKYTQNYGYYYSTPTKSTTTLTTLGFGIGFGGKWITKSNIIFELSAGIGKRFRTSDDAPNDTNLTSKGMLGIGYRF
jgi:hypothetical protein